MDDSNANEPRINLLFYKNMNKLYVSVERDTKNVKAKVGNFFSLYLNLIFFLRPL